METTLETKSQTTPIIYPYLLGCLIASIFFLLLFLFIGFKIGSKNISNMFHMVLPLAKYKQVLNLPKDVLEELTKYNAVIENAGNPTKQGEHDTLAVLPDQELTYVLRPGTKMFVSMLKSTKAYNFDPPVLHLRHDDQYRISKRLKAYLKDGSRLNYSYSIDSNGCRKTVPYVNSSKQVLLIGDSVPFGVGVDDDATVASHLQKMVGNQYRITNASVGGYDGQQAFLMAAKMSSKTRFAGLIYIACQNDFMEKEDWSLEASDVMEKFKSISHRFDDKIILMLHTYMEYNLLDVFLYSGWKKKRIENTDSLRNALPRICKGIGCQYYDWTEIVNDFMMSEKSVFSRFALYADHCHLSPLGNKLMAEKLFKIMDDKWQG